MYRTLSAPLSVHLELTTLCNHKCLHCYNYWRDDRVSDNHVMNKTLAEAIVKELAVNGVFHVVLNGGEPTTNLEVLLMVAKLLGDVGITFSVNSNLSLVDIETADLLKNAGIKTVLTSLLSFDEQVNDRLVQKRGAFKKTVRGIESCLHAGISVAVNMVVMKTNLHHVYQTGLFCKSVGIKDFSATRALLPKCASREFIRDSLINIEEARLLVEQLTDL